MIKFINFTILLFLLFPLIGCMKFDNESIITDNNSSDIDDKSYINHFELLQKNSINDTNIKISSPKAIIDQSTNDIEIFSSSIIFFDNKNNSFEIKSGKSTLNNSANSIRVFDNVLITSLEYPGSYIKTKSFNWELNESFVNLDNPLYISFKNTKIISSFGSYDIGQSLLNLNDNIFNRNIFNDDGKKIYEIEIKSDFANWLKNDNTLNFLSNNKQVETTIKFLSIK